LIIVAYLDNKPVGYDRFGYVLSIAGWGGSNPEFRGNGVMKAMMEYFEE